MIELRWIVRNTGVMHWGCLENGELGEFPQTEQVLQWRGPAIPPEWKVDGPIPADWSDWQDVPLVRED